ncbi:tRNA (5-methylaminomethyl-2-thiouridine)(34)-methyltransferase MnmD [Leptospira bouyouniensis]|uniref:S-adenosyl-L-methionine-dependent methyltransferase n=1 Tax=Leptospira bouyouniensis TaxID=2484911 RepID=A0ABY2L3Z4_9LEPT|nr:tRNA (5-methylaminomethyl-2-thiouridine)(34)-methyltransferase MnmD [Leptospira bouyouniensis]TGK46848.1 S-adenosyl-L-methionine-dependent methyltransferase [Leptospira bouyouniensis]
MDLDSVSQPFAFCDIGLSASPISFMDQNRNQTEIELKEGVPISLIFGDVYFSKEGGWEESKYVFLEGNRIPDFLTSGSKNHYKIGELGFGTGLNFFVTLAFWYNLPNPPPIHFYSLEGFPLPIEILQSLNLSFPGKPLWTENLLKGYQKTFDQWIKNPLDRIWKTETLHPLSQSKFTLEVLFGDVSECLDYFPSIDFWYLDGFSPKKNPMMWSEETLSKIKTHSQVGTRLATFTAAGFIRRTLEGLGFMIQKQKGFGKKREMITGVFL